MAYNRPFIRLTVSGGIAGEDIWSNGFSLSGTTLANVEDTYARLNPEDFATIVRNFYINVNALSSYCTLTTIKLSLIGTNGKTVGEPKFYDFPTALVGQYNGAVSPQDSIVVSLMTPAQRGIASKGRTYLPPGFGGVGPNGRLIAATTTTIRDRFITFINAINTLTTTLPNNVFVCIVSAVGTGETRGVTGVRVGNMVDTQRRRRNRLTETYVEAPLVTP